jgi:hypothetical protein
MTVRRLCQSLTLVVLMRAPTAPAVEALTTSVEAAHARNEIARLEKKRDRSKEQLDHLKELRVLADLDAAKSGSTTISRQNLEEQYRKAEATYFLDQSSLQAAQTRARDLQALTISPNFQVNTGSSASAVVPGIDASGSFVMSKNLDCQLLFSVKPDPPAGTTAEVTQSIRTTTGVFSANLGMNYNHFWNDDDTPGADGPQGVEVRAGLPVAYQRASSTDQSTPPQSSASSKDFGLLSPELKASLWLKYVLLGYKYTYYFAFGSSSQVYDSINRTGAHKVYLATKLQALSGDNKTPFYLEATYTSSNNGFSGGTFSFAASKSLSWNPK